MGRVVVVGSLNVDRVTRVDRHPGPGETVLGEAGGTFAGGKGANQAVAAREAGADVAMIGCVGRDADGDAYRARLSALGVEVSGVRSLPGVPTGTAHVVVDAMGENAIIVVPGANGGLSSGDLAPLDRLSRRDVVLLQLEVPLRVVDEAVRRAVAAGARVVLNLAPYAQLPAPVVALADPVVVNEPEAALLRAGGAHPASLVVTRGAAGAVWDGETAAGPPVAEVVDTTGAGDAFCGALAAALARGADRAEALTVAVRAGSAAVARMGAQPDPELAS
jgi:ribokinase